MLRRWQLRAGSTASNGSMSLPQQKYSSAAVQQQYGSYEQQYNQQYNDASQQYSAASTALQRTAASTAASMERTAATARVSLVGGGGTAGGTVAKTGSTAGSSTMAGKVSDMLAMQAAAAAVSETAHGDSFTSWAHGRNGSSGGFGDGSSGTYTPRKLQAVPLAPATPDSRAGSVFGAQLSDHVNNNSSPGGQPVEEVCDRIIINAN